MTRALDEVRARSCSDEYVFVMYPAKISHLARIYDTARSSRF
jgi:hypothetical protein